MSSLGLTLGELSCQSQLLLIPFHNSRPAAVSEPKVPAIQICVFGTGCERKGTVGGGHFRFHGWERFQSESERPLAESTSEDA